MTDHELQRDEVELSQYYLAKSVEDLKNRVSSLEETLEESDSDTDWVLPPEVVQELDYKTVNDLFRAIEKADTDEETKKILGNSLFGAWNEVNNE